MADVTALARRVLIINRGRLLYDGELSELVGRIARTKRLELVLGDGVTLERLAEFGAVRAFRYPNATLEVPREEATRVSAALLSALQLVDLSIQDPPIEEVIRRAFQGEIVSPEEDEQSDDSGARAGAE
jgi:ABC-2 type transport system ATP-binding protein